MQFSPTNQVRESDSRYPRRNDSIASKISAVEFDFLSDNNNSNNNSEESPVSSCRSSLVAERDASDAALNPRGLDSIESKRHRRENQSDLMEYQISKIQSMSVGKVIDETIAAIEATNRELLSRAQEVEKSTRILQEQNSDLQRTLKNLTRNKSLETKLRSPPLANLAHRSRPSLNFPISSSVTPHHRNSIGLSARISRPEDTSNFFEAEPTALRSQQERHSDIVQSMQSFHLNSRTICSSLSSPLPLYPVSSPSAQHNDQSKYLFTEKSALDLGSAVSSNRKSSSASLIVTDGNRQPLTSHYVHEISSPLPGSVRHHSVVLPATMPTDSNPPKLVSLEEARRRAKSTTIAPFSSTNCANAVDNHQLVEGNTVSLRDEILWQKTGEREIKSEKKKSRLQDLFTGRRHGSRDEKM